MTSETTVSIAVRCAYMERRRAELFRKRLYEMIEGLQLGAQAETRLAQACAEAIMAAHDEGYRMADAQAKAEAAKLEGFSYDAYRAAALIDFKDTHLDDLQYDSGKSMYAKYLFEDSINVQD